MTASTSRPVLTKDAPAAPVAPPARRPRRRPRVRSTVVTVALCVAAVAAFLISMVLGQFPVSPVGVVEALFGGGDAGTRFIVTQVRLPRAAIGFLVGAALALAGALTQAFTRNPLASPDFLGVTSGASAAAVATIVIGGGTYGLAPGFAAVGIPVAAAVGGLLTALVIFGLA